MNVAAHSNDDLRELYRELILDHARNPRHFGRLSRATHSAEGINPLCGDKLKLYVRVGADERIADARFEGTGCAISVASASLMTDTVIGMTVDDALAYFEAVVERLTGAAAATDGPAAAAVNLGKLHALEGVREFPSRVKCATLAWHAFNSAIRKKPAPATTE